MEIVSTIESKIDDSFPDEVVNSIKTSTTPWYTNIVIYLTCPQSSPIKERRNSFPMQSIINGKTFCSTSIASIKSFEDVYRKKWGVFSIIVMKERLVDTSNPIKIAAKVLQRGFYWPTLFKDAHALVESCNSCQ